MRFAPCSLITTRQIKHVVVVVVRVSLYTRRFFLRVPKPKRIYPPPFPARLLRRSTDLRLCAAWRRVPAGVPTCSGQPPGTLSRAICNRQLKGLSDKGTGKNQAGRSALILMLFAPVLAVSIAEHPSCMAA